MPDKMENTIAVIGADAVIPYLSPIQAGFLRFLDMTEFNCLRGLQSVLKPLSIYTVVLLDGHRRKVQWKPTKSKRWKRHLRR